MLAEQSEWRGWGDLIGCRCVECEEQARRFVCLILDRERKLLCAGAVSEDGRHFGCVGRKGETLDDIVDAHAAAVMRAPVSEALSGHGWSGAFQYRGHDGGDIVVKIAALPLFDGGAAPAGVQITLEDKTRAYAQSAEKTALRDRLSIIQQYAADGILSIDEKGVIESVNRAAEAMFGWRAAELVGRSIALLMPPCYAETHQSFVERYLRTGQSGILNVGPRRLEARRKDGSIIRIELTVAEAIIGKRTAFIGVCRAVERRDEDADAPRMGLGQGTGGWSNGAQDEPNRKRLLQR